MFSTSKIVNIFIMSLIIIIFLPFYNIFNLDFIVIDLGIKKIYISDTLFYLLKYWFIISYFLSSIIILLILNNQSHSVKHKSINLSPIPSSNELNLLVGFDPDTKKNIYIPEKGLYQNILITGTIGTGKTSSAMYPFTKQLLSFSYDNSSKKIGMLILDVKGNYYKQVKNYCTSFNRTDDLIIIELNGKYKYNPLHKPHLKPSIIANQLKSILLLFSTNNTESYWLDKAEAVLSEAIKLCRIYNDGYVTFLEIHKLIMEEDYYNEKIEALRNKFINNNLSKKEIYDLITCINFFSKEFFSLDSRTLGILKSEISRITNCFISDFDVMSTFCPDKQSLNFLGFDELIDFGKIVVLNMNINEYRNLSKIIAAYLKLDFQTEVLSRLSKDSIPNRITSFICDEYSEYAGALDANFFSQSREAKCINIISTQSYTSLLNAINNQYSVKIIVQNLVNKFWFRTDDIFTIEDAQKQLGKIEKEKSSRTISENAKKTTYNPLTKTFNSKDSNISESINNYSQFDYIYDTNFFTQQLETFSALSFLSDGSKIITPKKIIMFPFFN